MSDKKAAPCGSLPASQLPEMEEDFYIIGIIDGYDAVHSVKQHIDIIENHADIWPAQTNRLWRYCMWTKLFSRSMFYHHDWTGEEIESIKAHMERQYRIRT